MRAAVVESRPLIGFGIQQVLYRIKDIDDSRLVAPGPSLGLTLDGIDLLIVGDLQQGYDPAMLQLLGTAANVRGVLYLSAGGTVQWMPPREISPLLSWLPENATLEAIEETLRKMIGILQPHADEPGIARLVSKLEVYRESSLRSLVKIAEKTQAHHEIGRAHV